MNVSIYTIVTLVPYDTSSPYETSLTELLLCNSL